MSFKKVVDTCTIPCNVSNKDVNVFYFYKTVIEDDMDEEVLFSEAFNKIDSNESFDVIKFIGNIWFGISINCTTCIYIDFNDDEIDVTNAIKFFDKKHWKLNAGFMYLDNNYTKIIVTSSKPPNSFFLNSVKWQNTCKCFKISQVK